jgi:hypothetical protein
MHRITCNKIIPEAYTYIDNENQMNGGCNMSRKKCYLASANTSAGFYSFFDYVIKDAERVYIIKGGPGCGKSTFIRKVGEELLGFGFDVDFIYCSADKDSLDGIFIPEIRVAIVDGTAPHGASSLTHNKSENLPTLLLDFLNVKVFFYLIKCCFILIKDFRRIYNYMEDMLKK